MILSVNRTGQDTCQEYNYASIYPTYTGFPISVLFVFEHFAA